MCPCASAEIGLQQGVQLLRAARHQDRPLLYQLPALPFLFAIIIRNTVYLAVFNLIPIPPLDGSRLLTAILPDRLYYTIMRYERVVMGVMMLALFTGILNLPIGGIADAILLLTDRLTFFL